MRMIYKDRGGGGKGWSCWGGVEMGCCPSDSPIPCLPGHRTTGRHPTKDGLTPRRQLGAIKIPETRISPISGVTTALGIVESHIAWINTTDGYQAKIFKPIRQMSGGKARSYQLPPISNSKRMKECNAWLLCLCVFP